MTLLFDTPPLVHALPWIADYTSAILYAGVSAQLFRWDARRRQLGAGACVGVRVDAGWCDYELRIDPSLRWHDGSPVRAHHYADSIGYAIGAGTPASNRLGTVVDVAPRTSGTLAIRLARPDRQLPAKLAHPAFGPARRGAVPVHADGAGPFRLTRLDALGGTLEKTASGTAMQLRFAADPEEGLARYLAGDIDVTCAAAFPLQRLDELSRRADFHRCTSTTFFVLVPLSARAGAMLLKQHLQQALDLPALAAVCPGGLAPCAGFASMHGARPPFDPRHDAASSVPAAACSLTLAYDDFYPNRAVAEQIAAQLATRRISVALLTDDYARPAARADFKLAVLVNSESYPADLYRRMLRAPALAGASAVQAAWRAALDAFDGARDARARAGALARLDRLLAASLPVIPLLRLNQFCLKRPALHWFEWNCDRAWLRA